MDFNEAAVFVKVVDAGSFSAAARLLGLPTSTVSTRVARLEKRIGATLLQRTTRRLRLTESGAVYYQHASTGLSHLLDAEAAVTESAGEPKGLLRVTAPADLGDRILVNIINRLRRRCPLVRVEMMLIDRYVDLIAEGIDVAIRVGPLKNTTLIAKSVGHAFWVPFASPDYLKTSPPLDSPSALAHHSCLQFTPLGGNSWTFAGDGGTVTIPMPGKVVINDIRIIHSMALAGEGVALLPVYLCRSDGDSGRLTRVLPEWHAKVDQIHIVYPRQRFIPSRLRAFIDLASQELQQWLDDVQPLSSTQSRALPGNGH